MPDKLLKVLCLIAAAITSHEIAPASRDNYNAFVKRTAEEYFEWIRNA